MHTTNHKNSVVEYHKKPIPEGYPKPSVFINLIHPISQKAAVYIDSKSFFCTIPKGKTIIQAGIVCPYLFLINKGLLRSYFKDGHKDITTWISAENEMATSISSFFGQLPSLDNIQAIEDCELTGFHYEDLQYLYDHFPEVNVAARKLLELYYRSSEERAYIIRLSKASFKYNYFLKTRPFFSNRIPLKYIASFLGVTIETLSRLRKDNSIKKTDPGKS